MPSLESVSLKPASPFDLPADVAQLFWHRSSYYTNRQGLTPPQFSELLLAEHEFDETFISFQEKVTDLPGGIESEFEIQAADVDEQGHIKGRAEVRYLNNSDREFHIGKPFVSWTKTEDKYIKEGLARRRYLILNAACLSIFNLPLNSGSIFCHDAVEMTWKRLVMDGLAEPYVEHDSSEIDGLIRYRFLTR